MVKVGMGNKDMLNALHFSDTQITNTSASIDQNIIVNQKRACCYTLSYSAATSQNTDLQFITLFCSFLFTPLDANMAASANYNHKNSRSNNIVIQINRQ